LVVSCDGRSFISQWIGHGLVFMNAAGVAGATDRTLPVVEHWTLNL